MTWQSNEQKARWRRDTGSPGHRNGPKRLWDPEEDARVVAHSVPDRDLARELDRSVTAIQCRRVRLKKGES